MTRAELIEKIAKDAGITKTVAGQAMEAVVEGIKKTLKKGNKVTLTGFGTFSVAQRKARVGRNPKTGEAIKIKASKTPKFTASKQFKSSL